MFLTTHVSTTLLLCQGVSNPILAFFIGLISHYLLDIIPHGDYIKEKHSYLLEDINKVKQNKEDLRRFYIIAPLDVSVALLLTGYLYLTNQITNEAVILVGVAGAILPDALIGLNYLFSTKSKIIKKINSLHLKVHTLVSDIPFPLALSGQMFYNILILYILYFSQQGTL